jgi:hypothetical protein
VHAGTQAFRKACMDLATTLDALAPLSVQSSLASDNTPLLQAAEVALMGAFDGAQRLLEKSFNQVAVCVANSQVFGEALRVCMEVMQGLDAGFKDVEKTVQPGRKTRQGKRWHMRVLPSSVHEGVSKNCALSSVTTIQSPKYTYLLSLVSCPGL